VAENDERKKAAIFIRELPIYPPDEILGIYYEEKWCNFTDLLNRCKGDADTLYVPCPETLGDDYLELLVNLSKVAEAGLKLLIAGPAKSIKVRSCLDLGGKDKG
jgi:hypothetical protein